MLSLSGYCQFSAVEPVHMPTSSTNAFRSLHICTNMTYFYHSITKKKKRSFVLYLHPPLIQFMAQWMLKTCLSVNNPVPYFVKDRDYAQVCLLYIDRQRPHLGQADGNQGLSHFNEKQWQLSVYPFSPILLRNIKRFPVANLSRDQIIHQSSCLLGISKLYGIAQPETLFLACLFILE